MDDFGPDEMLAQVIPNSSQSEHGHRAGSPDSEPADAIGAAHVTKDIRLVGDACCVVLGQHPSVMIQGDLCGCHSHGDNRQATSGRIQTSNDVYNSHRTEVPRISSRLAVTTR
jgi:hypothetical protein